MRTLLAVRWILVPVYLAAAVAVVWLVGGQLGREIFPTVDTGQFQLRLRAPTGTRIEVTEQLAVQALETVNQEAGPDKVAVSVGYLGLIGSSYPINTIYLWMRGPEEAVLRVALKPKNVSHLPLCRSSTTTLNEDSTKPEPIRPRATGW